MPDVPSLSFAIVGLYFFLRWTDDHKWMPFFVRRYRDFPVSPDQDHEHRYRRAAFVFDVAEGGDLARVNFPMP